MEDQLFYSKCADLKVISPKKNTLIATLKIILDQIYQYCGLAKLTHKINHHKWGGGEMTGVRE